MRRATAKRLIFDAVDTAVEVANAAADARVRRIMADHVQAINAESRVRGDRVQDQLAANTSAVMEQIQHVGELKRQVSAVGELVTDVSDRLGRPQPRKAPAKKAPAKKAATPRGSASKTAAKKK